MGLIGKGGGGLAPPSASEAPAPMEQRPLYLDFVGGL